MNFIKKVNWHQIRFEIFESLSRFPLAVISGITLAILYIFTTHKTEDWNQMQRYLMCLHLAIPLSIAVELFSEKYYPRFRWIFIFVLIAFLCIYFAFFTMESDWNQLRFLILLVVSHLLVSIAPFIFDRENNKFYNFNVSLFQQFFICLFYASIIVIGLDGALWAIDALFDLKINTTIYLDIFFIVALIFHPVLFTSRIPILSELADDCEEPKSIEIIVKYILLPFTMLYFFIIYAFGLKLLTEWNLPHGWVGKLCLSFLAVGIGSYLLNFSFYKAAKNKFQLNFSKYFFQSIIPIVILLAVGLLYRVRQYGFTELRVIVLAITLLLFGLLVYYLNPKNKGLLKWIPIGFSCVGFILSLSPWSANSIAITNQSNRFISLVKSNDLLMNDVLDKSKISGSSDSIQQLLYSKLHYLVAKKNTSRVDNLFNESLQAKESQYRYDPGTIHPYIRFIDSSGTLIERNNQNLYFSIQNTNRGPIGIEKYSYCKRVDINPNSENNLDYAYMDQIVFHNKDTISIVKLILDRSITIEKETAADLNFKINYNGKEAMFSINNISIIKNPDGRFTLDYAEGLLFYQE